MIDNHEFKAMQIELQVLRDKVEKLEKESIPKDESGKPYFEIKDGWGGKWDVGETIPIKLELESGKPTIELKDDWNNQDNPYLSDESIKPAVDKLTKDIDDMILNHDSTKCIRCGKNPKYYSEICSKCFTDYFYDETLNVDFWIEGYGAAVNKSKEKTTTYLWPSVNGEKIEILRNAMTNEVDILIYLNPNCYLKVNRYDLYDRNGNHIMSTDNQNAAFMAAMDAGRKRKE